MDKNILIRYYKETGKTIEIVEFMLILAKYSRLLALAESKCMSRILLFQSRCYRYHAVELNYLQFIGIPLLLSVVKRIHVFQRWVTSGNSSKKNK